MRSQKRYELYLKGKKGRAEFFGLFFGNNSRILGPQSTKIYTLVDTGNRTFLYFIIFSTRNKIDSVIEPVKILFGLFSSERIFNQAQKMLHKKC